MVNEVLVGGFMGAGEALNVWGTAGGGMTVWSQSSNPPSGICCTTTCFPKTSAYIE